MKAKDFISCVEIPLWLFKQLSENSERYAKPPHRRTYILASLDLPLAPLDSRFRVMVKCEGNIVL